MDELIGSHEAAVLLGLSYATYYKRWERGRLPFDPVRRIGTQWLWRRSDVTAYARLEGIAQ